MMQLHLGDCLDVMIKLPDASVDSVVTDPPYGLSFMGKKWDYDVPSVEIWKEIYRILKPGGHVLSFGGTRTYHRMVVAIEDAGFEIRDQVAWHFGSGFPKSHDVYKTCLKKGLVCECESDSQLPSLRKAYEQVAVLAQESQDGNMQLRVQRRESRETVGDVRTLGIESADASELHSVCNAGSEKPGMEGRSDLQAQQGQLHRPEVCAVPEGLSGDGSQGRLYNGASTSNGDSSGPDADSDRGSTSQGPRHKKQSDKKPRAIPEQSGPQTCGSCGKTKIQKGLGTALKPAFEPIVLARKPLEPKLTVAANVLKFGTGAINVDASRIGIGEGDGGNFRAPNGQSNGKFFASGAQKEVAPRHAQGRWPANVLFDEEAAEHLDESVGDIRSRHGTKRQGQTGGGTGNAYVMRKSDISVSEKVVDPTQNGYLGGPSRYFYVAKASKRERNAGLEGMPLVIKNDGRDESLKSGDVPSNRSNNPKQNFHPTVKPIKLMEYLVRMITPPGGIVLDPFMGSGTTGCAAVGLGFGFVGIEREAEYIEIARKRIEHWGSSDDV